MNRLFLFLLVAVAAVPLVSASAQTTREALDRGVLFIQSTQQPDGGFGGFGPGQSMDAIFAIRAAGYDPNDFEHSGNTPADFLIANAAGADTPPAAAKAALAAIALGLDPRNTGGTDFVAVMLAGYDAGTGRYAGDDFGHPLVMVALAATVQAIPPAAIDALRATQESDGGWGFGSSDPDTTAIAIQGLVAAGLTPADPDLAAAVAWLKATQLPDGGWGYGESNASSTAFVVQALLALGESPSSWAQPGGNPVSYLLGQQLADGSFAGFDPAFATNQVLPALAGRTFASAPTAPITEPLPDPSAPTPTPAPPAAGSGSASGGGPGAVALVLFASLLLLGAGAATSLSRQRR